MTTGLMGTKTPVNCALAITVLQPGVAAMFDHLTFTVKGYPNSVNLYPIQKTIGTAGNWRG